MVVASLAEQALHQRKIHADAVIRDHDIQVVALPAAGNAHRAASLRLFQDAGADGVFHQRLEDVSGHEHRAALGRQRDLQLDPVVQAEVLNLHVELNVTELLLQGDQLLAMVQADPVELGERLDITGALLISVAGQSPADQVQRVVQEVRIDLALQKPQLQKAHLTRVGHLGVQRVLQFVQQQVKGALHSTDLVASSLLHPHAHIAFAHAVHRRDQPHQPPALRRARGDGDPQRDQKGNGQHAQHVPDQAVDRQIQRIRTDAIGQRPLIRAHAQLVTQRGGPSGLFPLAHVSAQLRKPGQLGIAHGGNPLSAAIEQRHGVPVLAEHSLHQRLDFLHADVHNHRADDFIKGRRARHRTNDGQDATRVSENVVELLRADLIIPSLLKKGGQPLLLLPGQVEEVDLLVSVEHVSEHLHPHTHQI